MYYKNMNWSEFENMLLTKHIYTINNNSSKNIVLFGSCHMATIGYMLNKILNYQSNEYNIHIIISWFFENKGLEKFDMKKINDNINFLVSSCDVFIYHHHINDYSINATILPSITKENCLKLIIPNYRLDYTINYDIYSKSLNTLSQHILNSSFPEFIFVIENHKNIMFFNTIHHPTHYLLFLQTESIRNRMLNYNEKMSINNYFDVSNRNIFKQFDNNYVYLPGKENITNDISNFTGINMNADYFD
jgi:hypothetical protein